MNDDITKPNRSLLQLHPAVMKRWEALKIDLELALKCIVLVNETYRSDARQQWLYGAGRSPNDLLAVGLDPRLSRPSELRVTNAYSAKLSAHGHLENGIPAAVGLDVIPLGQDGKPWSKDDPWDEFVRLTTDSGVLVGKHGLIHFKSKGKQVTDKPHLQAIEWSDATHTLGPLD